MKPLTLGAGHLWVLIVVASRVKMGFFVASVGFVASRVKMGLFVASVGFVASRVKMGLYISI